MIKKNSMISIIIPIYNAEKTISICIDSVLHQTLSDWELILVDDGSNDKSGPLCDEYASIDKRIQSIHQTNGGPSKARNTGINVAKGEWITFIDADDWITSSFLIDFFKCELSADVLYYQKLFRYSIKNGLTTEDRDYFFSPCAKLYNLSIIKKNNLSFSTHLRFGEDALFNIDYCEFIKTIEEIDAKDYCYTDSPLSLSKTVSLTEILNGIIEFKSRASYQYIIQNPYYHYFVNIKISMRYELALNKLYKTNNYFSTDFRLEVLKFLFLDINSINLYYPTDYKSDKLLKLLLKKEQFRIADAVFRLIYQLRLKNEK